MSTKQTEPWWTRQWTAALAAYSLDSRFQRGQAYARQGNVVEVSITKGLIEAKVQGTESRPYRCSIKLKLVSVAQWQSVTAALAAQAAYSAQLLQGTIADGLEEIFQQAGVSLFPQELTDFSAACSCPDIVNPCKHIVAVLTILGHEFKRDPFLIFTLRGKTQAELLKDLAKERATLSESLKEKHNKQPFAGERASPDYWGSPGAIAAIALPDFAGVPTAIAVLGRLPGCPADFPFEEVLEPLYRRRDK